MNIYLDLDGTLINIKNRHYMLYHDMCVKSGGKPLSLEKYWDIRRGRGVWIEILKLSKISQSIEKFALDFSNDIESQKYLKHNELFDYTLPTLKKLTNQNNLYLVTLRQNKKNLLKELNTFGLTTFFKEILSSGDNKTNLISMTNFTKNDIVVGDTEIDIFAAKELGLASIAVLSGIRNKEFLQTLSPTLILPTVELLPDVFKK